MSALPTTNPQAPRIHPEGRGGRGPAIELHYRHELLPGSYPEP
jgi:hypothetical protein